MQLASAGEWRLAQNIIDGEFGTLLPHSATEMKAVWDEADYPPSQAAWIAGKLKRLFGERITVRIVGSEVAITYSITKE